jgi:hypothetical protein
MKKRKSVNLSTEVLTSNYRFFVNTNTTYFEGNPSGGMEDMPGWFMNQSVYFHSGSRKEDELVKFLGKKIPLCVFQIPPMGDEEITSQPIGYEQLRHRDLVRKVKENPDNYLTTKKLIEILKR